MTHLTLVTTKYKVKLSCGHTVVTEVELIMQYPTDKHFIRCPYCMELSNTITEMPHLKVPTAWSEVTSVRELSNMSYVLSEYASVMPESILRLQPGIPPNRLRIFKYKSRGSTRPRGR